MYDKAICINLDRRPDRRLHAEKEFNRFGFHDVKFHSAVDIPKNGMAGLHRTMRNVFREYAGEEILVFEDDVKFNMSKFYFDKLYDSYLPKDFYMFYLGGNATKTILGNRYEPIRLTRGGYLTSHAILYSRSATMDLAAYFATDMPDIINRENTFDVFLSEKIQPLYPCYVAYPAIASQYKNHSDICGFEVDYDEFHTSSKKFYK